MAPVIVWLDPFGGVSGDMLLGALLDLGAPVDEVREIVASTGVEGWELRAQPVLRAGLVATRALVTVEDDLTQRPAAVIAQLVARARPAPVADLAGRAVALLAQTEAALHGVAVADVHLHELGGVDTVVDAVGVAAALHLLGATEVACGPLPIGSGSVRTRHGQLPLPAPAVAALLARGTVPVVTGPVGETVTPTGIALLLAAQTRFGPLPAMTVTAAGRGAGARDVADRPNVVAALLGTPAGAGGPEEMVVLETNVDDVTGEVLGHLVGLLLDAGAADAWISPIVMKKSRPAHTVHVLAPPRLAEECERILLAETGSLGVRRTTVQRHALTRRTRTVDVAGHPVRVTRGPWRAKAEHDDVAAAAAALGLPLREVAARAVDLDRDLGPEG
ncbi:MAG: nickel pincer cofactor biosynthesis protein LarC [Pseudonocardia sp.]